MPAPTTSSFYDIEPLRPWLEAGVPILTPNFRLARRIKLAWGQFLQGQGQGAWPTPPVMSLEHWWLSCQQRLILEHNNDPMLQIATQQQELSLWQSVISQNPHSSALLRPRAAAQLARDAWHNLLLWQVDCNQETIQSRFAEAADSGLFLQWLEQFRAELQRRELTILPEIARQLAASCPVAELALVEFDELAPLYQRLLEVQAGSVHRYSCTGPEAAASVEACINLEAEMLQAAHWARSRSEQGTVAILLPDLAQRRQSAERVLREAFGKAPDDALPANISAGMPLDITGPVRTALGLLALYSEDATVEGLVGLIHSRYRPDQEREAELELLQTLYRKGHEQVRREDLRYWCRRVDTGGESGSPGLALGRQLLEISHHRALQSRYRPGEWQQLFSHCLETLGWPGTGPLNSVEYQQVEHWYQVLEQLAELDRVSPPLEYSQALQLLRQLCADTVFQPQTDEQPIQVLGMLEAAGLQFDHLWVCGLSSTAWPPPASPNPFIPVGLQRALAMPHADAGREYRYAEQQLFRLRHSCRELVVSYALLEEDIPGQPSPLLQAFDQSGESATALPLNAHWLEQLQQGELEALEDRTATAVSPEELQQIRGGSGLIADQSQCPFRALVHHRLNTRALPDTGVALDAAQRGTLMHDALHQLWSNIRDQASLLAMTAEEKQARVAGATLQAVEDFARHNPSAAGRSFLEVEQQRLQRLLLEWLEVETQRAPFSVAATEARAELALGDLLINLRIDRIDMLDGGQRLVIDYKSGHSSVGAWLGERPEQPQLPLYGAALVDCEGDSAGEHVGGMAFAKVRYGECGYEGLARSGQGAGISDDIEKRTGKTNQVAQTWAELQDIWRANLERLAREFLEGDAAVAPLKNQTCDYCGLQALCRIGESGGD